MYTHYNVCDVVCVHDLICVHYKTHILECIYTHYIVHSHVKCTHII